MLFRSNCDISTLRYLLRSEKANIFYNLAHTAEILDDARFLFTSAILKLFHSEARSSPVLSASHVAQKDNERVSPPILFSALPQTSSFSAGK